MRMFPQLLGFLGSYRLAATLAILLGFATVASNVGLLALAAYLISAAALKPLLAALGTPIFLVRFFAISRAFARYAERLVSHDVTFGLLAKLRSWFYRRLEPLAPARLLEHRSGDLLSRIVKDVEELENIYLRVLSPLAVAAAITLATFALLRLFDPALALAALGFLLAAGVGVPLVVNALARGLGREQVELRAELDAGVVDGVQGVQDLLALSGASGQREEMGRLDRKLGRAQGRMARISGLQGSLGDLLANLAVWTLLVLAIPLVSGGEISGVYLAFLALIILGSFEAVSPLGSAFQFLGRSLKAGERLFEVVDIEPRVTDPTEPVPVPDSPSLEFRRVGFAYREGEPPALEDVSFTAERGSRVAVVGPSGSGKSTLANLALRFWDPTCGEVRLGGRDVREYAQEEVRERVSLVAPDTHLFSATLRANLLLANPEATDDELWSVLHRARLAGVVERLPEGLNSRIGEQGLMLSGGERQRLAVARALLKDAPILVLDEPTANLDTITERELLASIGELARGHTILMLTHRLVAMESMDDILVMDRGKVVERGAHAQLVKRGGLYRRMLQAQNQMLGV